LLVVNHSGAGSANEPSAPTHRYAGAMSVSLELLDPNRTATRCSPRSRRNANNCGKPAPRLRRTGPHPQHVRHLVPRLVTEQAPDAILTLHRVAEQEARTLLSRRRSAGWRWRWRWW